MGAFDYKDIIFFSPTLFHFSISFASMLNQNVTFVISKCFFCSNLLFVCFVHPITLLCGKIKPWRFSLITIHDSYKTKRNRHRSFTFEIPDCCCFFFFAVFTSSCPLLPFHFLIASVANCNQIELFVFTSFFFFNNFSVFILKQKICPELFLCFYHSHCYVSFNNFF